MKKNVTSRRPVTRSKPRSRANTKHTTTSRVFYTKFYIVGFAVLAVAAGMFGYKTGDKPLVLGTSILAENGSANDGSGNGGPPPNQDQNVAQSSGDSESRVSDGNKNALVDCAGPDGKHIQVTFQECAGLNKKWNHPNFSFTMLRPQMTPGANPPELRPSGTMMPGERMPNASNSGMQRQGRFQGQRPLGSPSAGMRFGANGAQPPVTAQNAVARVLQSGSINSVENEASSAASVSGSVPNTTLTQVNNHAVYKINGFANKKVLGIFPASFAKTIYVSADNGNVVKTDETFFSKFLEALSF